MEENVEQLESIEVSGDATKQNIPPDEQTSLWSNKDLKFVSFKQNRKWGYATDIYNG